MRFHLLHFVFVIFLSGCAAPPSVPFRPFGNNAEWMLDKDMIYRIGTTDKQIVVKKGFVTDYASTPTVLSLIGLSPNEQYSRAAVVHDYLYWTQICTKAQADNILRIAMKESDVPSWKEFMVYHGVDMFGRSAWKQNSKEKASGLLKVVPVDRLERTPRLLPEPNEIWEHYRNRLREAGIREEQYSGDTSFCDLGNSSVVP